MERIQIKLIIKDLAKKMGIIVGPRQVGKTYVSKKIAETFTNPVYLSYDQMEDRELITEQAWSPKTDLIVLDELHKMPAWKNYLKGLFDTKPAKLHILVTGSARLDIFNKIGDSLAGRYFLHRLLPLSPSELFHLNKPVDFEKLLQEGGFPEPYLADNAIEAARWRLQYSHSMLSTDVFDFDMVQNLKALKTVFELLRIKVGTPISYQSLAEDVAVSPNTIKKYIEILEALFIIFRVTPYSNNIARSILKEPKLYFFDNGLVKGDEGAKLENLVAVCLLKSVYGRMDYLGENIALHYLRTKDGQEVDFALVNDDCVEKIIEVKNSNKEIDKSLFAFHTKNDFPAIQLVKNLRHERKVGNIQVMKAAEFLMHLFL